MHHKLKSLYKAVERTTMLYLQTILKYLKYSFENKRKFYSKVCIM